MNKYTKIAAAVLGVVATMGVAGVANAAPLLQILGPNLFQETTGDAGGTSYPWGGGSGGGAGVPSANAGWPNNGGGGYPPGFAPDPSFPPSGGGALGTSGYDTSYLFLTQDANVTFQFMGAGDSSLQNHFLVGGVELFRDGVTNPIAVAGDPPAYSGITSGGQFGQNQYTIFIDVPNGGGYVQFSFVTGNGVTLTNNGTDGNPSDESGLPGYMLGIDPYLATGTFQTEGTAVFAGLSDRSRLNPDGSCCLDHDYQDMGVRISVPEPGSIFLLGAGLMGLAFGRRRQFRNMA